MSILIKGMKMPMDCESCTVAHLAKCELWITAGYKQRHKDCPLVEVPATHGRLIDEAYISQVEWCTEDGRYIVNAGEFETDAPTIIEAEEGEA